MPGKDCPCGVLGLCQPTEGWDPVAETTAAEKECEFLAAPLASHSETNFLFSPAGAAMLARSLGRDGPDRCAGVLCYDPSAPNR